MAALTADRAGGVPAHKQVIDDTYYVDFEVAASTVIFKGGFVGLNAVGNLVMFTPEDITAVQNQVLFIGIAQEHINSQTAAGDATCRVQTTGYFTYPLTSATILDVGKSVYATDSQTLAKTGVCSIDVVGTIVHLDSAGNVVVRLKPTGVMPGELTRVIRGWDVSVAGMTMMILHEQENHNGGFMSDLAAVVDTVIDTATTDAIVTVAHTTATETTLGLTLDIEDNAVALELLISGAVGKMFGIGTADLDNMIAIPPDVAVMLVQTTEPSGNATGIVDFAAKIMLF